MKIYNFFKYMVALGMAFLAGCGVSKLPPLPPEPVPPPPSLMIKLSPQAFPRFSDSRGFEGLNHSLAQSLVYFNRVPKSRTYLYGEDVFDAGHMIRSMETFQLFLAENPSPEALNEFIQKQFWVYQSAGNDQGQVLFTGYYEPIYKGSLTPDETYQVPVFSLPADLLQIDLSLFSDKYKGHKKLMARLDPDPPRVIPYYSRKEINEIPHFKDRATPIAWLENPVDRFFLEIQGSGRVVLAQGGELRIHYAGTNGHAYQPVGRYLIDQKEIAREKISMQAIRQWLEKNPHRMDEVFNYNESFVFFKTEEGGPFGSINVEVTALRSIATDPKVFPRGGLGFVMVALPDPETFEPSAPGNQKSWDPAALFVLNQDTGGAIKGPARADLFCGNGAYAEFTAGHMNTLGQLYFLVLKP